jgi:YD repeat-containing protein
LPCHRLELQADRTAGGTLSHHLHGRLPHQSRRWQPFIQETDVHLPGLGGGLTLTRTWNSLSTRSGMFGANWLSNFEERIDVGGDGYVRYLRGDGSVWVFAFYPANQNAPYAFHLVSPGNVEASLTETGPDSDGNAYWTVGFQNGERRVFNVNPSFLDQYNYYQNNDGPLSSIIDRNGNATALNYEVNQQGVETRLLSVSDAAGRHLYFTYGDPNAAFNVTGVTSDSGSGINLTYDYDRSAYSGTPILIQVTQADNTFATYNYDLFNNILSVNDTAGKVLESHTYDTIHRGLSSARANGVEALSITYP